MKSCIVISGQYRTFDQTWQGIKEFIDLNELDVYCHIWSDDTQEIENVKARLKPKAILSHNQKDYEDEFLAIEQRIRTVNPKGPNTDRLYGAASMHFGRKKAFDLVQDEYDMLVYCRYDIRFEKMFQFTKLDIMLTPLEESYNLISDIFAVMPFQHAKHFFIYDEYERLYSTQFEPKFEHYMRDVRQYGDENMRIHMHERYCPHMALLRNLYMNGVKQVNTNQLTVSLQR
jgi:hypothetical protein